MYGGQWITNEQAQAQAQAHAHAHPQAHGHSHSNSHGHIKEMGGGPMSTEELMLQVPHLQGAPDYSMDASMSAPMGHPMPYQQRHHMQRHPLPAEQYNNNASFTEGDSQMMERDENDEGDSVPNMPGPAKPASTRSSANNELEMRQLFGINRHRSLQDVAGELHGNERGPNSERTRQVFAMLWYVMGVMLQLPPC
jgi:regulatory factor X